MTMITLTFPDGAKRDYENGSTGFDVAKSISKSLAKKAVAITFNGDLQDLNAIIPSDGTLEIVMRDDEAALDLIRHDTAHVMAEAVQDLWPGTQVTIGPSITDGFYYDFAKEEPFVPEDLEKIEKKMRQIIERNAPIERVVWHRDEAIAYFKSIGEKYKAELISDLPEDEEISVYRQGDWLDLCKGPHLPSTGKVGTAFKLMKIAGSYWRGDSNNAGLQRIYGTAWQNPKQLKAYLTRLEEAEKRDHRKLGREMDLFHFQEEAPGAVFWHAKGWTLFLQLIEYMRRRQQEAGYIEVNSPDMMERTLWEKSGHWEKFGDNMFTTTTPDERVFACKPMNCPGHVQIFKHGLKSYRDLPLKIAEFGKVHRYEPSGALHGIMRVRHFTQDDAHIFCTREQITEECIKINTLMLNMYKEFGFEDVAVKFSDRPEKRVGSDEIWDESEAALRAVLDEAGVEWTLNSGEGAFYGPKLEYVLRDAIGRDWQCGTLQLDFNLPERLGAFYIGSDSDKHAPVMIHRAMFGSLERFTGILIEHHAGRLPLWLAPVQVVVTTIVNEYDDYARKVKEACEMAGLRCEIDLRNEKINYKVREHSLAKVPAIFVCGQREMEEGTISIRRLGSKGSKVEPLHEAIQSLVDEGRAPDYEA